LEKNGKIIVIMAAAFALFAQNAAAEEHPWQLRKNQDGITVYVRPVDGSPILEYKATVNVKVPIEKAVAYYEDPTGAVRWFHQCSESRLLESRSDADKIMYMALDMPWPVSNRDAVYLRARTPGENAGVQFAISAVTDVLPPQPDKVRMPYLKGVWRFTPLPDGGTEIYVQQHADAGGHIPAAIVNRLVVDIPFNSLKNFRKRVSED
jgi:hypothetical protein